MDFNFGEEHQAIVEAASRVFSDLCGDDEIKALAESDAGWHETLWAQLAESGILGLALEEDHGGMALTLAELCGVLELQGRHVAPVPLLSGIVQTAMVLQASGNAELAARLLPGSAVGSVIMAPVRSYQGLRDQEPLKAAPAGSGLHLTGVSAPVPYAAQARGFLVAVGEGEQAALAWCDAGAEGIERRVQKLVSNEPAATLMFRNVAIDASSIVARGAEAERLFELQRQWSYIASAAIQVGALEEGLRRTAEYVSQRKQFGRPLGAFQAVAQQAADAYMVIEALRSVYWRALDDVIHNQDAALSSRVARYWVGRAGHKAAHAVLHLHGGIGQDLDYPVHRFFLWAKQIERYLGSPAQLAAETGDLLATREPAARVEAAA